MRDVPRKQIACLKEQAGSERQVRREGARRGPTGRTRACNQALGRCGWEGCSAKSPGGKGIGGTERFWVGGGCAPNSRARAGGLSDPDACAPQTDKTPAPGRVRANPARTPSAELTAWQEGWLDFSRDNPSRTNVGRTRRSLAAAASASSVFPSRGKEGKAGAGVRPG